MEAIPRSNYVTGSHRATLRCKYLGNSGRISVSRYESPSNFGRDTNKVIVSWNYALDISENYEQAVLEYLRRANWGGHWITSTCTGGAVAVYAGEIGA
jgi:hypothetical protein